MFVKFRTVGANNFINLVFDYKNYLVLDNQSQKMKSIWKKALKQKKLRVIRT